MISSVIILAFACTAKFFVGCGEEGTWKSQWLFTENRRWFGPAIFMGVHMIPMLVTISAGLWNHYKIIWDSGSLKQPE